MFKIPSIQAQRIFVTACETGSFTKAAEQLGISQGAVSQHIKSLEIRVGFKVFARDGRGVELTKSGERLLAAVREGLGIINRTITKERQRLNSRDLIVSVHPGFAVRWLFTRLVQFNAEHPDIAVSVNAVSQPTEFSDYNSHAALGYLHDDDAAADGRLFIEHLVPVCSPRFAREQKLTPLETTAEQLIASSGLPLIGDESLLPHRNADLWAYWAGQTGLDIPKNAVKRHSQSNITLQLAELGYGVALGRTSLIMDALKTGKLVPLTPALITNPFGYYLIRNTDMPENRSLAAFGDWLARAVGEIEIFDYAMGPPRP